MDGIYVSSENLKRIKQLIKQNTPSSQVLEFLALIETNQSAAQSRERNSFEKILRKPKVEPKQEFSQPSKRFKEDAKKLRKKRLLTPTPSEKIFADALTKLKIEFVREKLFFCNNTYYFADFYFPTQNLVIEIDGGYHKKEEQAVRDNQRTSNLINLCGVSEVLRIANEEFNDVKTCITLIKERLNLR